MKKILALMLVMGFAGQFVCADEFDDLATYKYCGTEGDSSGGIAYEAFEKLRKLKADEKPAVEQKLIAVISNKDATQDGKAWACRFLQIIGTEASVPALSGLLQDEILSTYARLSLERMTGSKVAAKALRDALGNAPAKTKIGIVSSLGMIRDTEAVQDIESLAKMAEGDLAKAALMALGKIADGKSADALLKMDVKDATKQAHWDALIECAARTGGETAVSIYEKALASDSQQHRSAALMGMCNVDSGKGADLVASSLKGEDKALISAALTALATVKDEKFTSKAVSVLNDVSPAIQAKVITVLGVRGDKTALKDVVALLKSEDKAVKEAAVMSAALLGDAGVVKILLATDGVDEKVLGKAIEKMSDPTVDAAIVSALGDAKARSLAVSTIISRNVSAAVPELLKLTKNDDWNVRKTAWNALGVLTGEDKFGDLVAAVRDVKHDYDITYGAIAVRRSFGGINNKAKAFSELISAYDRGGHKLKIAVLEMGSTAASSEALQLEIKGLNSGNADLAKAAVKAMSAWQNPDPADELLNVAKTSKDEVLQILALRGYISMAQPWGAKMNDDQRMEILNNAHGIAKRADEKKRIISGLRSVRNDASLKILIGYLNDAEVKRDAEHTASDILRHMKKATPEGEKVAALLAKSEDKRTRENAEKKIKEWEKNKK